MYAVCRMGVVREMGLETDDKDETVGYAIEFRHFFLKIMQLCQIDPLHIKKLVTLVAVDNQSLPGGLCNDMWAYLCELTQYIQRGAFVGYDVKENNPNHQGHDLLHGKSHGHGSLATGLDYISMFDAHREGLTSFQWGGETIITYI